MRLQVRRHTRLARPVALAGLAGLVGYTPRGFPLGTSVWRASALAPASIGLRPPGLPDCPRFHWYGARCLTIALRSSGLRIKDHLRAAGHREHQLKNVLQPMRVYRLVPAGIYRVVDP
jgi:hypothetical protein